MDVTKAREDFSTHLLKLDELNRTLIQQISDLQSRLNEQENQNLTTKGLLLKTQSKLMKTSEENRNRMKQVAQYKNKLRQSHEKTMEAEKGWIKLTKYLKSFHNNCTCQSKDRPLTEPSPVHVDIGSPSAPSNTTTVDSPDVATRDISPTSTSPRQYSKPKPVNSKLFFCSPKSPNLSHKRSSASSKVSSSVISPFFKTSPKQRVSKLKRTKPTTPKSVKKLCLSSSPGMLVDESLVLYAADTQVTDEDNESLINSDISLVSARTPVKDNPIICPDSPVSPIVDLGGMSQLDLTEIPTAPSKVNYTGNEGAVTPTTSLTRETRQFGLLTEWKGNISISEEKLGFSLPENMTDLLQGPFTNTDREVTPEPEDDDFKISSSSKPSNSTAIPTKSYKVKTDFKYTKVVRKKEERAKMAASSCASCYRYYKASGLDDEEIAKLIGDVSRHRHQHGNISNTPPSFWDLTISHDMPTEPATQRKPKTNRYRTRMDS